MKKILSFYLYKGKYPFLDFELAGVKLKGLEGTFRIKTDQDDAWFFELAKYHDVVFDIGANIGYMSLLAAMQPNNKQIVLVDPNQEALAMAAQNLIINGFGMKCNFVSAFIGEIYGDKIKFYTVGSGAAGSMYAGHAKTASLMNSYYLVNQLTIDYLVEKLNCSPNLIKIDVEGAESFVLKGAVKVAKTSRPKFMVEMHSPPEMTMECNTDRVLEWCGDNNYTPFYMKESIELKESKQIAHRGKCHLLLIPKGEIYPLYLRNIKQGSPLPNLVH